MVVLGNLSCVSPVMDKGSSHVVVLRPVPVLVAHGWHVAWVVAPEMKFCSLAALQEETLLTDIYVVIQVVASLLLVALILLHSGKGGGLSDMFGAGSQASSGSTVAEKNLDRITITVALIFTFTTVTLALRMS